MNTLEDLNNYGATLLTVQDLRLAKVTFENEPLTIPDVIYNFAGVSTVTQFNVINQVNIIDISNYTTCNVRYRATIIPSTGSPAMSLIWNDIPAHVTLSQSGYQYTLSGIQTAADWDRIKTFKWQVPANVNTFNFYLKVEILWYDEETATNKVKSWNAYDPARYNFYFGTSSCVFTATSNGSLVYGLSGTNNAVFGSDAIGTILYGAAANNTATFTSTGNLTFLEGVSQATFTSTASGDVIELYDGLEVQFDVTPTGSATNEVFTGIVIGSTSYNVYRDDVFLQTTTVATNQTPAEFNIQSWVAYSTGVSKSIRYKIVANSGLDPVKFLTMGLTLRTTPGDLVTTCSLTKILNWSGWTNDLISNNATYNTTYLNSAVVTFNPILGTAKIPSTVTQVPARRPKGPKWGGLFRSYPTLSQISSTIAQYDASNATDFRGLFESCNSAVTVTDDFSSWNPVNVTDMRYMFYKAANVNPIIGSWNTSSVTNMSFMFYQVSSFNRPLNWNTANVTDFRAMFYQATGFNGDITTWNTGSATNLRETFQGATSFNQPIGSWNISNVTTLQNTFNGATAFNQPLNTWNTGNVNNMNQTFYGATAFNQPLGAWDTSKVTTMEGMFQNATVFNGYIATWNTGLVTTTKNMFNNARAFNENIMNWNVSAVTNMSGMFNDARLYDQPIGSWNTGNVTDMSYMFAQTASPLTTTAFNQSITSWNTTNVTTMQYMFYNSTSFNQSLSSWNTSNLTNLEYFLSNATAFNSNIVNWNLPKLTNARNMFERTTATNGVNLSGWTFSAATLDLTRAFQYSLLTSANINNWTFNNATSTTVQYIFYNSKFDLNPITTLSNASVNNWAFTGTGTLNAFRAFAGFDNGVNSGSNHATNFTVTNWNFNQSGSMSLSEMFSKSSFNRPIDTWVFSTTKGNINADYMFNWNTSFNQPLSSWKTSKFNSMLAMFRSASAFNQNLNQWCVSTILSKPLEFDTGATAWTNSAWRPVWGTCPNP